MASLEKHYLDSGKTEKQESASVEYALHHCFRSFNMPSRNTNIDSELTKNNYLLSSKKDRGNTKDCMDYYKDLLNKTYIYGKASDREIVRLHQWSIQAPGDLAEEQKSAFFEACYSFLNNKYGEDNCIAAIIHTDEIVLDKKGNRVSHDHMHYLAVPKVENGNYVSAEQKRIAGMGKLRKSGFLKDKNEESISEATKWYSKNEPAKNDAIREIAKKAGTTYADAKTIYRAIARNDSEKFEFKLNSSALTSRKQLHEFHPKLQQYLDERGIKCTVSYKSQGISRDMSYTIAEAKTVTRITGLSIDEIKSLEKERTREQERTTDWGNASRWGNERSEKEWEKTF